jgi:hypothetical protein
VTAALTYTATDMKECGRTVKMMDACPRICRPYMPLNVPHHISMRTPARLRIAAMAQAVAPTVKKIAPRMILIMSPRSVSRAASPMFIAGLESACLLGQIPSPCQKHRGANDRERT